MRVVETWSHITDNLHRLVGYLQSGDSAERGYAHDLLRRGRCFVISGEGDDLLVGPSRFVGYIANTMEDHRANVTKDGRDTNPAISGILAHQPDESLACEEMYQMFCRRFGIERPARISRKYWQPR